MMPSRQAPSLAALALCLLAWPVHSHFIDLQLMSRQSALPVEHRGASARHSVLPELPSRQLEASYEGFGDVAPGTFDEDPVVGGPESVVRSPSGTIAARQAGKEDVSSIVHDQPVVRDEHPHAVVDFPSVLIPEDVAGSSLEIRADGQPQHTRHTRRLVGGRPPASPHSAPVALEARMARPGLAYVPDMPEPGDRPPAKARRRRSTAGSFRADGTKKHVAEAEAGPDSRGGARP